MNKIMLICQPCVKNTETREKRGCRRKTGLKRGVLRVGFGFCQSSVIVGTKQRGLLLNAFPSGEGGPRSGG